MAGRTQCATAKSGNEDGFCPQGVPQEPPASSATKDAVRTVRFIPRDWVAPLCLEDIFTQGQPLEVDVGCGKGRFLLARAAAHPETNFLGLDRMLRRIRKVDRKAVRRGLFNIRLMRVEAYYATAYLLPPASVHAYYIFFPDPWPKKRHHDHRLFNEKYREALSRTLIPGGHFHFASDHLAYGEEVSALFRADPRWEEVPPLRVPAEQQTDFEQLFSGQPIGRYSFRRGE